MLFKDNSEHNVTAQSIGGFGLGLRPQHYEEILAGPKQVDWFEVISENYMVPGGKPLHYLDRIRADYPMVMHGVSLSIGSTDPLDEKYLRELKTLADRIEPAWFSDHLCWTGVQGKNMHDLLPLPYTEEALAHVVERVKRVQDHIGRPMLLENVSSYVTFAQSALSEWDFLAEVARRADCGILLDVNNIYVSGFNHEFAPQDYFAGIPGERIGQIHLAGHSNYGNFIIDTHDAAVIDPVWHLYGEAIRRFGPIPTMIERDDKIPPYQEVVDELQRARQIASAALRRQENAA